MLGLPDEHFWHRLVSTLESCLGVGVGLPDPSVLMSSSLFDRPSYVGPFGGVFLNPRPLGVVD